jgi:hypothetical protein
MAMAARSATAIPALGLTRTWKYMTTQGFAYRDAPYSLAEVRALFPASHPLHRLAVLASHCGEHPAVRDVTWEGYAYRGEHLVDLIVLVDAAADLAAVQEDLGRFGAYAARATGARFRRVAPRLVARADERRPAYTLYFYWAGA